MSGWICAEAVPEGQDPQDEEQAGKEDRCECEGRAGETVGFRLEERSEVGGEREERSGKSLSAAISGEEGRCVDPTAGDGRRLEQRQHDVSAAKDERAGAVEGLEDSQGLRRPSCERKGRGDEQKEKERQGSRAMLGVEARW